MSSTAVIPMPVLGKRGINTYLVLGRRPIVVDAGLPGNGRKIYDQVAQHGVDPKDIALIVLTHAHIDHFGAATELRRLTGAPVAGHVGDLAQYRTGQVRKPYLPTGPMGRAMAANKRLHIPVEEVEPDVLLTGELNLSDYGVDGRIMPTPGHTAGSVSVLLDSGDLVAGDLVANAFMGLIPGRPANPPFHDDARGNLASLQRMLALQPTTLHVGHGPALDPERVRRWAREEDSRLRELDATGRLARRTEEPDTAARN
ncbi:MBL fold metallo-hydrolase [Longispora fulva]|uniref:Glyoxylase-like metal-dependent hydrolase (Beta-lactamase superfamily II) n=1 Tax=Longispora fulva TaxID=619741 RepID=A0A8J7GQY7_9ACTN|nr:MBL fold metallo-hydrolase [Longispora fulva]MBG6136513.1 glyoxylase-like metal-dependent hydrolase (beta-lactamase superfamily II) [Longispora fulva]GIG59682.1 MBL fold metallo-hydrolase [Longispora fulva]